ncbi:MAG: protease, partial [Candidatus Lokiarchaeota archaeon]|nr:protease [Candidatus Lokiarchaeota archaeon]
LDQSVVIDGNLVTSRSPADLPDFMKAILGFLSIE